MTKPIPCYQYNTAIVRKPAPSVVNGLRANDRGNPDYEEVKKEHNAYIQALESVGMDVTVLPELADFPDSIFVEDPALVFTEGVIILKPGAPSRLGEAEALRPALNQHFDTVLEIENGFADGGDILATPAKVMIGISERTDPSGAEALIKALDTFGYKGEVAITPKGGLHFKTACSLLDEETVLMTHRMDRSGIFKDFKSIVVPKNEEGAANAVRINDSVLVSAHYPRTLECLDREGFSVKALTTSAIEKIDAGLSCMSLRWFADR